jgi:hypothetical protein
MAYTTINKGSSYFNTVLYTGNGVGGTNITGVGFKPDLVWIKRRSAVEFHVWNDAVRGVPKNIYSNSTNAEDSGSLMSAIISDGFTVQTDASVNGSGSTYVAWNWLGANSTASNTSGSITSTVSANTTAGFSIVSYTGTNVNATVGHGLGVAPKMVIVKSRSDVASWHCYHSGLTNANYYILLNSAAAEASQTSIWQGTAPTSSVFSIGVNGSTNASGQTYIAYCFAEIKGYSKIGSFVGNGSTDGPFVYTGFKPAFVIQKKSTTGTANAHWRVIDSTRSTYNVAQDVLFPSLSNSETNTETDLDILSNGFKIRNSGIYLNESGITYIYMAFASNPFVTSTQIPTTAR